MIAASAVDARQPQRRGALAVRGLGIRARAKQQIHHFFIGPEHRPVKRGGAIGLRRIHIGVLLHELPHGHAVAAHHRVGNLGGAAARRGDRQSNGNNSDRYDANCNSDAFHVRSLTDSPDGPVLSPMLSW